MVGHFLQNSKVQSRSLRPNNSASSLASSSVSSRTAGGGGITTSTTMSPPQNLSAEAVAALPPPGLSGPSSLCFSPPVYREANKELSEPTDVSSCTTITKDRASKYLAFLSSNIISRRYRHLLQNGGATTSSTATSSSSISSTTTTTTTSSSSSSSGSSERQLCVLDLEKLSNNNNNSIEKCIFPLLRIPPRSTTTSITTPSSSSSKSSSASSITKRPCESKSSSSSSVVKSTSATKRSTSSDSVSLEERLRRERQRLHASGGVTQFTWVYAKDDNITRILVPMRGNIYVQDGVGYLEGENNIENGNYNQYVNQRQQLSPSQQQQQQQQTLQLIYDKGMLLESLFGPNGGSKAKKNGPVIGRDASAIDPQLSPDGSMVAFVVAGDIYVLPARPFKRTTTTNHSDSKQQQQNLRLPVRITYGATSTEPSEYDEVDVKNNKSPCVTHGLADFVAQEEMDRYRGFWWHPKSSGILFTRVDESNVPTYRITHQGRDSASNDESSYEDHRYPFAGRDNPKVTLGYVAIDRQSILNNGSNYGNGNGNATNTSQAMDVEEEETGSGKHSDDVDDKMDEDSQCNDQHGTQTLAPTAARRVAKQNWEKVKWLDAPREAREYLARVTWLPDGSACAQWQNRAQSTLVLSRMDIKEGITRPLLTERSDAWINLHHMMKVLPRPVHPDECYPTIERHPLPTTLPPGSFSFFFASERTGYQHLYLYTYAPGYNNECAVLVRTISAGSWVVESIVGVDMDTDAVYVTGTYDSPLERHLYALPITNKQERIENNETTSVGVDGSTSSSVDIKNEMIDSHSNNNNSSNSTGGSVRRGLKHVMSAFSGGGNSKPWKSSGSSSSNNARDGVPTDSPPPDPIKLTPDSGMHSIVMDDSCRYFVDTSSDLGRPTSVKVYVLPEGGPLISSSNARMKYHNEPSTSFPSRGKKSSRKQLDYSNEVCTVGRTMVDEERTTSMEGGVKLLCLLYDASQIGTKASTTTTSVMKSLTPEMTAGTEWLLNLPAPELLSFPTSDGTETLHAALYRPDPCIYGPGPYPLICAVYGGPHVQRVNRSWSQCADMRAQRLRSLGFAVVKCDNRGSSRRGLAFESAIRQRLGRLEVLDQVTTVRQLIMRGIADQSRVGIYGWSYGGYLSAMCLCRAPDVFHVAVAGAPVTSWDGYDTHYTERYMGLPSENTSGYREAAVFDHVPNMKGKLMIVHGLIDENVHFRHTARLINRLIASQKDYDLLIFPDERHSPRRLRDRIYMEQRISDYFVRNLGVVVAQQQVSSSSSAAAHQSAQGTSNISTTPTNATITTISNGAPTTTATTASTLLSTTTTTGVSSSSSSTPISNSIMRTMAGHL